MRRIGSILACGMLLLMFAPSLSAQESEGSEAAKSPEAPQAGTGTGQTPEGAEASSAAAGAGKARPKVKTLDELLERVRLGWSEERAENEQREARFVANRDEQARLLEEARAALAAEEARSQRLEVQFEENEVELTQMEDTLEERMGALGELFGVVRQVAGDTRGNIEASLVSAQHPGREPFLEELGKSKSLPSIDLLRTLWFTLLQQMTELGKVVRFPATVVTVDGDEVQRQVTRVGPFNAVANGVYLMWLPEAGKLSELARQPAGSHLSAVSSFELATEGMAGLSLDPSSGGILSKLVQTPNARERIEQGGIVGYVILVLGAVGGVLALARLLIVSLVGRRVAAQKGSSEIKAGNPLGRVLGIYEENREIDVETLELKLDQTIMHEASKLEKLLWLVKVVGVVAPLLGLLGTVTGMIRTFQLITLYGAGDPKLMASGISEALVTTMLGLCVAVPMVLLHALVSNSSKGVIEILEEQAAGMIARRAEQRDAFA